MALEAGPIVEGKTFNANFNLMGDLVVNDGDGAHAFTIERHSLSKFGDASTRDLVRVFVAGERVGFSNGFISARDRMLRSLNSVK